MGAYKDLIDHCINLVLYISYLNGSDTGPLTLGVAIDPVKFTLDEPKYTNRKNIVKKCTFKIYFYHIHFVNFLLLNTSKKGKMIA